MSKIFSATASLDALRMIRNTFLMAVLALVVGCTGGKNEKHLVLTGSSTMAPLMSEIAAKFERSHPGARVDVQSGGSSRGVADARRGLADIGMISRDVKPDESDLIPFTIARDGICMIVHRDNPVDSLTNEQIVAIYTGNINHWNQVGGNDAPITVVNKAEGRSTLELFVDYFGAGHFGLDSESIQADVVIGDNEQGVKTVAGNPNAIGYVSIGTAQYDAAADVPIKLLPLSGVEATIANVANGTFTLARSLNLVVTKQPAGLAKELIDFARSPQMNATIMEQYFVPISQ